MDRVERERSFHIVERVEVTPLQVAKGRALIPCFGPIGRLCKHLIEGCNQRALRSSKAST